MKDITDGLYQYGVEIEAIDGTVVFLNKRLNRLIAAKKSLIYIIMMPFVRNIFLQMENLSQLFLKNIKD